MAFREVRCGEVAADRLAVDLRQPLHRPDTFDHLVVHMQDVPFLDSAGVGALYDIEAFVKARGGDFAISTPDPRVRALLGSTGFGGSLDGDASPTPESSPRQHCDRQRATSR